MKPGSTTEWVVGGIFVIAIAIAFALDRLWGWRLIGIAEAAWGAWMVATRRIPYGVEGEAPVGYITGGLALMVGLAAIALGVAFIFAPGSLEKFFVGLSRGN
jgi:hypothetical protein